MRICVVTHYMPPHVGGVEQVARSLSRAYTARGNDVVWIASAPPSPRGRGEEDAVRLRRLPAINVMEERFGMPFPILAPSSMAVLAEEIAAADVVHIHDCLYLPCVAAAAIARRIGRPAVVTQHIGLVRFGALLDAAEVVAYRLAARAVLRQAARVVFVSASVRDWFRRTIDPTLESTIIPNAVDTARFRPPTQTQRRAARRDLGLPVSSPVVLFVGRLVKKKNLDLLVDALAGMDNGWLLAVGDGPRRDLLARLDGRVTHLASVPHERMPNVYRAADVFALPSTGEGLPVSLLEALASGLPCLVGADVAIEETAGCLGIDRVGPSTGAVAKALAPLLAEPAERARRGSASRDWVETGASASVVADRYLTLLDQAALRPRRS